MNEWLNPGNKKIVHRPSLRHIRQHVALPKEVLFKQIEGLFVFILLPPLLLQFAGSFPCVSVPDVRLAFVWLLCSSVGEPRLGH